MGVYIRGMEMPTSCANCELANHFDGYNENECPFNAFSYYDCPLTPVPPHGDLIDRDALYEDCALDHDYQVIATTTRINEYMQLKIDNASTIIEAEEVYDKYVDTAGNFHWCGTKSGEHTIKA